ncbi:MAG: hypothetical protein IAC58_05015 [Firmicutes bacterium]|uniref:Uncharacterized protein n=1 Tax=Candidatus Onthovivens merdipullorum TaxID=2840889 RepID=A0A9D9DIK1_9BACL|nr:hypothetical protein [Candidatus Onthovivens merdipullorum]
MWNKDYNNSWGMPLEGFRETIKIPGENTKHIKIHSVSKDDVTFLFISGDNKKEMKKLEKGR